MKIVTSVILGLVVAVAVQNVKADVYIAERPKFLAHDMPKVKECMPIETRYAILQNCIANGKLGYSERVKLTDGYEVWVTKMSLYHDFSCADGICVREDRERMEDVGVDLVGSSARGSMPEGYYFVSDENGKHIYLRGTGPYAQDYPQYEIYNEAMQATEQRSTGSNNTTLEGVWCNPRADYCAVTYVGGETVEYRREDLPEFLPIANVSEEFGDDHFCSMELCQDNDGQFIGLSPFYHMYQ